VSARHFGTGAELSGHFVTSQSVLGPKCLDTYRNYRSRNSELRIRRDAIPNPNSNPNLNVV